jgi:hypothetical protein
MKNVVKLLGIEIVSIEQEFDKLTPVLSTPTISLGLDVAYKENINNVAFTFTYEISNFNKEPVLRIKTKSFYSAENERNIFLKPVQENDLLLLANLAASSFHHTLGVFAVSTLHGPISQIGLLQLVSPADFLAQISESLQ